jgi:hypothetical protein
LKQKKQNQFEAKNNKRILQFWAFRLNVCLVVEKLPSLRKKNLPERIWEPHTGWWGQAASSVHCGRLTYTARTDVTIRMV